jgi:hypothetical protein
MSKRATTVVTMLVTFMVLFVVAVVRKCVKVQIMNFLGTRSGKVIFKDALVFDSFDPCT